METPRSDRGLAFYLMSSSSGSKPNMAISTVSCDGVHHSSILRTNMERRYYTRKAWLDCTVRKQTGVCDVIRFLCMAAIVFGIPELYMS